MPCYVRSSSYKSCIADLLDLNHVVRNKSVSSLQKLQRRLRLTDSTLTHDQYALAVYIDKNRMHRYSWSQLHMQPSVHLMYKCRCDRIGCEYRNPMLLCHLYDKWIWLKASAEYKAWWLV